MNKILVVDDEANVRSAFAELLGSSGHHVQTARHAEEAIQLLASQPFDLVILDICLAGISGLEALEQMRSKTPQLPVIVMTGHGTMETAIEATKRGAFDYHLKPFDPATMLAAVEKALEGAHLAGSRVVLGTAETGDSAAVDAVVGRSPAMQEVYKAIGRVAPTDATVLIRGESGTGKELIARAVYQHSRRSGRPLLVVNCAAIPETLLESELFGYERGAFTGATGRHLGKFEQADGGTIFLDEIGDVSLGIQAKILRVIQEKTFERLGGSTTSRVDVRVLAATNRDLEKAIASGGFREDLYHRLNVVTIQLPPLRDRPDDIPALTDYFLDRYAGELKLDRPLLGPDARQRLQAHSWPGNVRELEHCIQRVLIFARGYTIRADDLLLDDGGRPASAAPDAADEKLLGDLVCRYLETYRGSRAADEFLERAERLMLIEALRRTGNNQTHAARLLGLTRPTVHAKLQKHRLHEPSGRQDGPFRSRFTGEEGEAPALP